MEYKTLLEHDAAFSDSSDYMNTTGLFALLTFPVITNGSKLPTDTPASLSFIPLVLCRLLESPLHHTEPSLTCSAKMMAPLTDADSCRCVGTPDMCFQTADVQLLSFSYRPQAGKEDGADT